MKYTTIITLLLTAILGDLMGQPATQDATGKGSILSHGTYIGLDLTKPEVSLAINNLSQRNIASSSNFVYGGFLQGKNEEGFANIFSEGVPAASAVGRFNVGWRWSNAKLPTATRVALRDNMDEIENQMRILDAKMISKIKKAIEGLNPAIAAAARQQIIDDVDAYLQGNNSTLNVLDVLAPDSSDPADIQNAKKAAIVLLTQTVNDGKKQLGSLERLSTELTTGPIGYVPAYIEFIPFAFYGISGSSFKLAQQIIDPTKLSGNFQDQVYRGYDYGGGFNFRIAFLQLGATFAWVKTTNFKYLDKVEYTLRTTETQTDEKAILVAEKKITAYQGDFLTVKANEVNLDLIAYAPLSAREMMIINLYSRITAKSKNKEKYPTRSDFGLGVYFHKNDGKFLGGLYFQLPDTSGEVTKLLEGTAPSRAIKRFQFGLVTRYSLTSLLAW